MENDQSTGFQDIDRVCVECGEVFVWSASEQKFYGERRFAAPKRCKGACRAASRERAQARPGYVANDDTASYQWKRPAQPQERER